MILAISKALWIGLGVTVVTILAHVLLFVVFLRPSKDEDQDEEEE